ncbi:MAG: 2-C-methyl-D-erythritol 4-phosphate cytidylyltransferase [Hydrogenobacter thermophilus]|uniref:2-C-methyl-D-erythritol 4-phosphate cytidylyltransferase n=1 Tax=Hydrogenobacter thermophilus (strain DSM 6534 / IAM 12695 / TK-6) TaxID=608538 RepID=D3DFS0_HYDTT|nr:2-C-methyl-D-erythritol 4-phosphate cytidylyltransferase [Hydrogenobacter thermophilus]ADO44612.1 2-C-methyl-D-erythritol 4-phosphate cytidylyltransferase [Hydrogenobacter thermophilus TK-6]MCS7284229.1 2-C-methyl-D-erythritol 4-phosphate cytidylyltransferase [Hydrogenobacter thermophilus]BAI68672.1 2-C-methyl-D-erythritol 4-phosphate cytidylyltransferase [Hydrogenobacter thermophilus TK-6]
MISVILLSAGEGRRFGRKKQFVELAGKPIYLHSLEKVIGRFEDILLVLPEEDIERVKVPSGVRKVKGGKERQDSVLEGLLHAKGEIVVIHDCARPLADAKLFEKVCKLNDYHGKITAVPSRDTLKEVAGHMVIKTIDRSNVWLSQTPQAFVRKVLLECHFKARNEGFYATDDAALLERYGFKVGVVEGSFWNIKITYPEDLYVAETLLERMKRGTKEMI